MNSIIFKIKQIIWREQWNIAIAKLDKKNVLEEGLQSEQIQWLFPERKKGFYADPFLIEDQNKAYLFFEEYDYPSDKGVISFSEVTFDGKGYHVSKPEKIIEEDFHISYPFVFKKEGKWSMLAETSGSGHQYFYEATEFPKKWSKRKLMIENISILDPTTFEHDGVKWLFCSHLHKGENSKLYGFYWNEEKKKWDEHNGNPIVVGLGSSRPAGAVFKVDDKLYRPAQNSNGTYGKGVVINEIVKLSADIYEERKVQEIKAQEFVKYKKGTHTLNFQGDFLVIDGKRFYGLKKMFDPIYSRFLKKQ